ncbi:MAG: ABC transporter substrate-binding protein [Actinomycetaceae bacterium]|nr:ABC transporter substrate-binding protein [Arcanobacterium sp.]MDD7505744.1 ABC transporter substrate-binding protein [Actinomycetaceae bacterium]MDY6143657.1 ABC transporter substrate-binding protein [Arcanobacterium sp.]
MKRLSVLILGLILALGACSGGAHKMGDRDAGAAGNGDKPTTITVGLTYIPDIQFAPLYVAEAQGYFEDEGLNVTLRHHGAQENLLGALQSGEEDVVFAGGDEMMQARSTGVDVVNWATLYQNYPVALIVPEDSPIHSWKDLEGRTVGLPGPYGENYYALVAAQREYDLEGKVEAAYIGYTQATALEKGEVDAVIGFSNNDSVALASAGIAVRTIPFADDSVPLVGVGLGSMADSLDVPAYARLLDALDRAYEFAQANPEETLDITQTYVPALSDPTQREIAAKVLDATLQLYGGGSGFGAQNPQRWESMSKLFAETGITEQTVPAEEAYMLDVINARTPATN